MTKKLYGYKVEFNHVCSHSEREDKPYGDWSESWTTSPKFVSQEDNCPDILSIHNLENGVPALLVWCEWDSGDSFGRADGGGYEAIGLFKDMKSAKFLQKDLTELNNNRTTGYNVTTPDGQHFKSSYAGWSGYFEHLREVHIDAVTCF